MDDSGNSLLTYPKEIQLTHLSPLGHILTTHLSFVYPITKNQRKVTGFPDYDLFFRLILVVYNSSTSFHTRTVLVVLHFSLMAFTLPPFLRSCIRNHTTYSRASPFLLTQLVNRPLCILHIHLPVTLFWDMTPSQEK